MSEVHAFIEAEKTTFGVALLCRVLKVARSSFYAWLAGKQARPPNPPPAARYVTWACGRAWAAPARASTTPPPSRSSRC